MVSNDATSIFSAEDADRPQAFGASRQLVMQPEAATGEMETISASGSASVPTSQAAMQETMPTGGTKDAPASVPASPAAPAGDLNNTPAAGGLLGIWYWLRNQFVYGIPGLYRSTKERLAAAFTGKSAGTASKVGAGSDGPGALVWVLLAAGAAGVFLYLRPRRKGGKSIGFTLGRKAGIKLH